VTALGVLMHALLPLECAVLVYCVIQLWFSVRRYLASKREPTTTEPTPVLFADTTRVRVDFGIVAGRRSTYPLWSVDVSVPNLDESRESFARTLRMVADQAEAEGRDITEERL